jgi:hypothetical protein
MPQIGEKTLDASLRELENRGLIERKLIKIVQWNNAKVRGIKITSQGMEYNNSLYTPSHLSIMRGFEERIDELQSKIMTLSLQEDGAKAPVPSVPTQKSCLSKKSETNSS